MALATKEKGAYHTTSYKKLQEWVLEISAGLASLGEKRGGPVALIGENRTEWAVSYLAIVSSGRVVVPVDRDLKPKEILDILHFSEVKTIVSSGRFLPDLLTLRSDLSDLRNLISMETKAGGADYSFSNLRERGHKALSEKMVDAEPEIDPAEVAAILFTSGTMGTSKAVMLTHGNLCANIIATSQFVSIRHGDRILSVLPLHHTYECTCGFLTPLYQGASIYYAENLRRVRNNLVEAKATVILGVPLLFETMYRRIKEKGGRRLGIAKGIAAISDGLGFSLRRQLFKPLHDQLGGRLRLLISGGAALNPAVSRGFREVGINCIQGYGMTEASPLISVNREANPVDGSVGMLVPGVEARVVEGEILVRGANVMKGYYRNARATHETLEDGWLHTGDLGFIDKNGILFLRGRKKSVIVTPNGKNVYPEELEAQLNEQPFIAESLVWGGASEDPALTEVQAIIFPDIEALNEELGAGNYDDETIVEMMDKAVKHVNLRLANYKRIRTISLRQQEFEKTTTRKIKRYLYTGSASGL